MPNTFYQPGAREACTRLVLRLLYVSAFVCLSAIIMCEGLCLSVAVCHYSHEHSGNCWKFAGSMGHGMSS